MQLRSLTVSLLAAASLAAAQFKVTMPAAENWWVAGSTNVLAWDCQAANAPQTFTVLITNQDLSQYPAPLAIIAIQNNYDCSILITQNQASQAPGTGYEILLANPLNNTDVYARSEQFEIKRLGERYPSQEAAASSSASAAAASASASKAASEGKDNKDNGAVASGRVAAAFLMGAVGVVGGALAIL